MYLHGIISNSILMYNIKQFQTEINSMDCVSSWNYKQQNIISDTPPAFSRNAVNFVRNGK